MSFIPSTELLALIQETNKAIQLATASGAKGQFPKDFPDRYNALSADEQCYFSDNTLDHIGHSGLLTFEIEK